MKADGAVQGRPCSITYCYVTECSYDACLPSPVAISLASTAVIQGQQLGRELIPEHTHGLGLHYSPVSFDAQILHRIQFSRWCMGVRKEEAKLQLVSPAFSANGCARMPGRHPAVVRDVMGNGCAAKGYISTSG